MSDISTIQVPAVPEFFQLPERDFPISPRENLMRALNHEKPLWMPNFDASSQRCPHGGNLDRADRAPGDFTDWFGVAFKYSEEQKSATPVGHVFDGIGEWKEKVRFPDLDKLDWLAGSENFVRNEDLAISDQYGYSIFERFHALQGFENALIDMISEPEACREFFEAAVDFRLAVFERMNAIYHLDYVLVHDDWGTAKGPFFSVDLFKETLLPAAVRCVRTIQEYGVKVVFHNCGLIEAFVPFLVEEIGADALQMQVINDIEGIIRKYGARCTIEYRRPSPFLLFDPDTTVDQVKELGRWMVDTLGAHVNPGSGGTYSIIARNEEVFRTIDDEIYRYSLEKYRGL